MPAAMHAQTVLQQRLVSARCQQCEVKSIIQDIAVRYDINLSYHPNFFAECPRVTVNFKDEPLKQVLEQLAACARVRVEWAENQVIIRALRQYTLSGRVLDAETGEWLIGATVKLSTGSGESTVTNEYGFFSLRVYEGRHRLVAYYVGHRPQSLTAEVQGDLFVVLRLEPDATLPEVTIQNMAAAAAGSTGHLSSGARFSTTEMRRTPMLSGETDPMRYVALQPGVLTGVDGLGGLHVRGGNADQNLFLLDDVPVYNPSHALGLLSIFPSASINHAQLWKGDFPARYGGRAASVLDIRLRDGNPYAFGGEVSAGLFAGSVMVEGPLSRKFARDKGRQGEGEKGKSSFLISARHTYLNPWLNLLNSRYQGAFFLSGDNVQYRFYDMTMKANFKPSERDHLYLSLYLGGDLFKNQLNQTFSSSAGLLNDRYALGAEWGNNIAALRWNRTFKSGVFVKNILRYSRFYYQSQQDLLSEIFSFTTGKRKLVANYAQRYQTLIEDVSAQTDWEFRPFNELEIHAGGTYAFHTFKPGALSVNFLLPGQSPLLADSLTKALFNRERVPADEFSLYADAAWAVWKGGRLEAGLHISSFEIRNRTFRLLQPRLRLSQRVLAHGQAWAGYHRMGQFLHQVGTFNLNFPFELWVPTTPRALPEEAWQVSAGIGWTPPGWALRVEGYYKYLSRVLAFVSSTTALLNAGAEDASGWEDRIIAGVGWAKGLELTAEGNFAHTNLSLSYTLSQSTRQFPDLNGGLAFPFRFDRPHVFNVSVRQRLTSWLDISALWVYASGNPITLAGVKFRHQTHEEMASPREVFVYGSINSFRLPSYHRLDISCRFHFEGRKFQHEILAGAYNAYNRANPFFMYLDGSASPETGRLTATQYILLPLMPELRYTLRF